MSSRLPGLLLVCGLVAVVGACGFKLRDGNYRLPESWYSIGIKTGGNLNTRSPLVQELSLQLRQRYGARVELAATENLPGIVLLQEYSHNPVSALDRFGRAQEHMLEYIV
jgi:outer membrane lipopolysaccharide assembly protein LptE/RlpB